jgi:tyrosinase
MRFFTSLAALSLAFTSTFALPVEQDDHLSNIEARQSNIVITTGASGNVLPRYEVRQLKDKYLDQWTLFILAMRSWYTQSQTSSTSYFGIANIHGVPLGSYNGVSQCSNCGGATGYGVHDSVLFPPWHRAYMALFEQEMIKVAKTIANSYPASAR